MERLVRLLWMVVPQANEDESTGTDPSVEERTRAAQAEGRIEEFIGELRRENASGVGRLMWLRMYMNAATKWVNTEGVSPSSGEAVLDVRELPGAALEAVVQLESEPESAALVGSWVRGYTGVPGVPDGELGRLWLADAKQAAWGLLVQQAGNVELGRANPPGFDD